MPDVAGSTLLLLVFLSTAVERGVEVVMAALPASLGPALRRLAAIGLSLVLAGALAFGLRFDLVAPLLPDAGLDAAQSQTVTAIALAGGSAPAHELLRLIELAKSRLARQEHSATLGASGE